MYSLYFSFTTVIFNIPVNNLRDNILQLMLQYSSNILQIINPVI